MALTKVISGATALIGDLNQIIDLIEGAVGSTESFLLRCAASSDFIVRLADAAGARKFIVQDTNGSTVASVDSSGNLSVSGSIVLPGSTNPVQTTEGAAAWDTDDDLLKIGTGAATKTIGLSRSAGLSATATAELAYDTTASQLNVWNGSSSVAVATSAFDSIRLLFRSSPARRIVGEYAANGIQATNTTAGMGFQITIAAVAAVWAVVNNEPSLSVGVGAGNNGTSGIFLGAVGVANAALQPAKSPRMLMRIIPSAGSANVTVWAAGFSSDFTSATANGAMIRVVTTGHPFFVTRQGGTETTFDMGAAPSAVTGYEIETVDAGVTWVLRSATGTVLATQTTNIPTVGTALKVGVGQATATADVAYSVSYLRVEAGF